MTAGFTPLHIACRVRYVFFTSKCLIYANFVACLCTPIIFFLYLLKTIKNGLKLWTLKKLIRLLMALAVSPQV